MRRTPPIAKRATAAAAAGSSSHVYATPRCAVTLCRSGALPSLLCTTATQSEPQPDADLAWLPTATAIASDDTEWINSESLFMHNFFALPRSIFVSRLLTLGICCAALFTGNVAVAKSAKPAVKTSVNAAFDIDAFNSATDTPLLRSGSKSPAVARAQILLDRAWFSSGEIDGRFAANMQRIVRAYQTARGQIGRASCRERVSLVV